MLPPPFPQPDHLRPRQREAFTPPAPNRPVRPAQSCKGADNPALIGRLAVTLGARVGSAHTTTYVVEASRLWMKIPIPRLDRATASGVRLTLSSGKTRIIMSASLRPPQFDRVQPLEQLLHPLTDRLPGRQPPTARPTVPLIPTASHFLNDLEKSCGGG